MIKDRFVLDMEEILKVVCKILNCYNIFLVFFLE